MNMLELSGARFSARKYTNEAVDGKVVGDIFDEDFNKQVVLRIGC